MEAAVRAFEDWEFRVLEQESGIEEEEDESAVDKEDEGEMGKEISCQQHVVSAAQVNHVTVGRGASFRELHSCSLTCRTGFLQLYRVRHAPRAVVCPSLADVGFNLHVHAPTQYRCVTSELEQSNRNPPHNLMKPGTTALQTKFTLAEFIMLRFHLDAVSDWWRICNWSFYIIMRFLFW